MKVAISHDYLFQFGGAEKCVENWLKIYPEADIYTSFSLPHKFDSSELISKAFKENRVKNSFANWLFKIPWMVKFQKHLFWLYPFSMSFFKLKNYDLVIVSATYCGKNIRIENAKKILFYCYTPTRFLWNLVTEVDQKNINPIFRFLIPIFLWPLRLNDKHAINNLKNQGAVFIAISGYIQSLIKNIYKQNSIVVYPPVGTEEFLKLERKEEIKDPFYVYFGRISFHKRLDLVIESCLSLRRKLKIIGESSFLPEKTKLHKIVADYEAKFPETKGLVQFLGRLPDTQRDQVLQQAKAMIFTPKEDFGIAPVEALAIGCPVIAYKSGGALEYVIDKVNGLFFEEQTVESLNQAILDFEKLPALDVNQIKNSSRKFSNESFQQTFINLAT